MHLAYVWRAGWERCTMLASRFRQQASGQALVELALSITFIAYLFAAAVDLGIAYKTYQTLVTATSEAGNYLSIRPLMSCADGSVTSCDAIALADSQARVRFRGEQGDQLRGTASTLDLDSNGRDDLRAAPAGDGRNDTWLSGWVRIDEAGTGPGQVNIDNTQLSASFDPTAAPQACQERKILDSNQQQCFIVIRSQIVYRPFAISPFVGSEMTIRAISVKPITNSTR
jgi:hypothetical protein